MSQACKIYEPQFKNVLQEAKIDVYIQQNEQDVRLNQTVKLQLGKKKTNGLVKMKK
jgi:hypothetical protein